VQDSLSWFVDSYSSLFAWRATTDRLTRFADHIRASAQQQRAHDDTQFIANSGVAGQPRQLLVSGLSVSLPAGLKAGETLLQNLSLQAGRGDTVLFKDPSSSGKSTLFRILEGIWPFSSGQSRLPDNAMFIPQRPYFPDGTLCWRIRNLQRSTATTRSGKHLAMPCCRNWPAGWTTMTPGARSFRAANSKGWQLPACC